MNNFKDKASAFLRGRTFSGSATVMIIVACVVFFNMIFYTIGQNVQLYLRFDEQVDLSISSASDKNFADAVSRGDKVTVTFCMDRSVIANHSSGKFVLDTAERFAEEYPELITLKFVNIVTQIDHIDENGKPVLMENIDVYQKYCEDNGIPLSRYSIIFECGNKLKILTDNYSSIGFGDFFTFDSSNSATSYSGEETFASMVNYVLRDGDVKRAYFTTGHSEVPSISLYNVLTRAGYEVKEINLRQVDKIPDDAGLIVISNPVSDFARSANPELRTEIELLRSYAERGGNFLVTLDPIASNTPVLYDFLSEFGFAVNMSDEGDTHIVKDVSNGITTDGFTLVANYSGDGVAQTLKSRTDIGGGNIVLRYVAALTLSGSAKPLLTASTSAVTEAAGDTVDTTGGYCIAAYSEHLYDGGETASMVVVPSVFLTATDAIVTNGYANKDFIYAICETLYEQDNMIYGCNSYVYNDTVLENLTMRTATIYTAAIMAIPVALAAVGIVVIVKRKNR